MKKILLVTAACLLLAGCVDSSNENRPSGEQDPNKPATKTCISCNGQGRISYKDSYGNTQYIKCTTCNGTGIMPY